MKSGNDIFIPQFLELGESFKVAIKDCLNFLNHNVHGQYNFF
jgi:hypothetical protein